MLESDSFVLLAGTSHPELAKEISNTLNVKLGEMTIVTFPDGEISVEILDNVRGRDVFVLQTIARRPNHYLMELLMIVDALKRASAKSINVVIPYFGYVRQDRRDKGKRVPIAARLIADLLQTAGVNCGLTMDLHVEQMVGFFDIPFDNLYARNFLLRAVDRLGLNDYVVVAPDQGGVKRARDFAREVEHDFAIIDKRRVDAGHVEAEALIGNVKGRQVLLIDDLISTGETLKKASLVCKAAGAREIFAIATHGLLVGEVFSGSAIEKIIVTDTVPLTEELKENPKILIESVAPLFSQAIRSIVKAESISSLFKSELTE